ncbi:MAG: pentapeptide repeat-containing protein [Cyanobacteria bacterium J06641_5]
MVAFFVAFSLGATGATFASQQEVGIWVVAIAVLYILLAIATTRNGMAAAWKVFIAMLAGLVIISLASTALAALFTTNVAGNTFEIITRVSIALALAELKMTAVLGTGVLAGAFAGADIVPGLLIALIAVISVVTGAAIGAFGASVGIAYGDSDVGYWFTTVESYWLTTIGIPALSAIQGFYLGFRPLRGDRRDGWLQRSILKLISIFGTRFTQANLTDADFSNAVLKHANFRKALQERTCFQDTSYLLLARDCKGGF